MRLALAACAALFFAGAALAMPRGGGRPGDFDLYLLALTWSPGFCATGGDDRGSGQCDRGAGQGFLVHGLWPQYERGFPSDCAAGGFVQRRDLDIVRGIVPSEGLARHQWRKHGSCSGLSPARYFSAMAMLHRQFRTPDRGWRGRLTPVEIRRALSDANPGLRADMIGLACQRGPGGQMLTEIRLCLTSDLRGYRQCPQEVLRGGCRGGAVTVPGLL